MAKKYSDESKKGILSILRGLYLMLRKKSLNREY